MTETELAKLIIKRTKEYSGLEFNNINDFVKYVGFFPFDIGYLFPWRHTKEGGQFWHDVHRHYRNEIATVLQQYYENLSKFDIFVDLNLYI